MVEEGAGAAIETGDGFVEAPVDAVLRCKAVLVEIDHPGDALFPAFAVHGRGAVFVEELIVTGHGCSKNHPAIKAAGATTHTEPGLAGKGCDLFGGFDKFVHRLWRLGHTSLRQQLLVVEHGVQIEAVRQRIGCVVDTAAKLKCALGQVWRGFPLFEIWLEVFQHAIVGIERNPGVRHFHDIGNFTSRNHGCEFLEGFAPWQRNDFDLGARIGCLKLGNDGFKRLGALRAGNDFNKLQSGIGKCRTAQKHGCECGCY